MQFDTAVYVKFRKLHCEVSKRSTLKATNYGKIMRLMLLFKESPNAPTFSSKNTQK